MSHSHETQATRHATADGSAHPALQPSAVRPRRGNSGSHLLDARGGPVSGATALALQGYESALAAFQTWRAGAEAPLAQALREAPRFVMGHLLQAYLLVCSRDPRRVRSARPVLARAAELKANRFERQHLAALSASLDDDYELAKSYLGALLRERPLDALALQVAHALDYLTGDLARLRDRVASVLPAWSHDVPGYGSVLAMEAFSLEECGEYAHAEHFARAALALNPMDARAHHVMAHVFEMTERPAEGVRWMRENASGWDLGSAVATHCCWHLALFHLAQGQLDRALELYDQRIRAGHSVEVADLIDASALLWRIELRGGDSGQRWSELATAWSAHVDDVFCSFNDIHAMLAFVGAMDWRNAACLDRALTRSASMPTRHGLTTRQLGLSACRALMAFGRGDAELATALFASLPESAHRLGGSHAQRDVLHQTMQCARERCRTSVRSRRDSSLAVAQRFRHAIAGVSTWTTARMAASR
jgi:tetratricopeptide (TPR) repeat protein